MADRDMRTIWEKKGATDIHARAMAKAKEITTMNTEALISSELDAQLRAEFNGMIAGELEPIP